MKPFEGFEAKRSGGREILPPGGYVAKIINAKIEQNDFGDRFVIAFDITDGEYAGFFNNDYKLNDREDKKWRGVYRMYVPSGDGSEKDSWTKRTFGNSIWAIEESNPGYHWDWNEAGLKGKAVGVLFRNKEWAVDGKTGWTTECCRLESVDIIQSGKFKMPKDKPLNGDKQMQNYSNSNASDDAFKAAFEDAADEDLPF